MPGLEPDDMREQLLQGFSHILVDEYQDIDQDQYDLVSAIAGRSLEAGEGRLTIMAVGDDDQNVYAFRGANVAFIQRFQEDYARSKTVYMVENFRSSGHIIAAANQLIIANHDRMKGNHPIRINRQRRDDPPGGPWETMDPLSRGRVQQLAVANVTHQVQAVFEELMRLKSLQPSLDWNGCAVLARTNRMLSPMRAVFEEAGIPVKRRLESNLPLHRIREMRHCLHGLTALENDILPASDISRALSEEISKDAGNPWSVMLDELIDAYIQETADAQLPVRYFVDWLYEALAELRREKTLGKGLFLNTVHGAKGLEFEHVLILDGDWQMVTDGSRQEEERRLLYVAMTRAKETLCLLKMNTEGTMQPMVDRLTGPWMLHRRGARSATADNKLIFRNYQVVDLRDIFLSYAGTFPQGHPIHSRLAGLVPGDRLQLTESGARTKVCCPDGFPVAALSKEGHRYWADKRERISEIRVLGMVSWEADDMPEDYRSMAKVRSWELPLMEVVVEQ